MFLHSFVKSIVGYANMSLVDDYKPFKIIPNLYMSDIEKENRGYWIKIAQHRLTVMFNVHNL